MRALIILAGVAALAACGKNDEAANTQNVDQSLAAENISSNDVTAIDAVTGDAANMAADVDYSNLDENGLDAMLNEDGAEPPARPTRGKPSASPPASNSAAAATTNTQ